MVNKKATPGSFKKGMIPWNKGKKLHYPIWNKGIKGIMKRNEYTFTKGMTPWNKGLKGLMMGDKNPRWKGGEAKLHCILCKKSYYRERCRVSRSRFCSAACKAKYHHSGEKHWNWKGGASDKWSKLKESEPYRKWRKRVFLRDKWTCRWCGHRSKESRAHGDKTSDIHAHHIKTRKDNPELSFKAGNGITLCKNCHERIYGKEKQFAMIFKGILNDYTNGNPKG